jgi:eukaryotic-like serine/threonine-protein kinase
MNSDRWRQIDELFDAVLDLPETERESYLFSRCNGDEALKQEVLSLLKAQSAAGKFMESPALNIAAQSLANQQTVAMQTNLFNRLIGTYKVLSMLGAGGMGEVYLAADEKLKRSIALKVLSAHYAASDERIKRFELEAHAVSLLNHPNIVTIFDVGQHDGINYIATEFVEGKSLRELIGGSLKIPEVLNIIIQVCEALSAAHKAGIIHRDIKPENIMLRPDGYVKVLDFGLAKLSDTSLSPANDFANTAHGIIVGTPAYMSPAQISGDEVDYRTDLWSVGVVLYELLTGVNPFRKDGRQATFQAVLSAEPPPARTFNKEISLELEQILTKALKKDAAAGYQTAVDFRTDLRRVRREYDSLASFDANRTTLLKGRKNQSPAFLSLPFLLIFFFALLAAGVGFWFSTQTVEGTNWKAATNIQLTDQAGVEYFPALAPDGKSFVFAANHTDNYDIYTQRVGGKNPINLTADSSANDTQPAFSPDGTLLAFRSEREPAGIYIMGATGENVRRVADFGFHPSWSPDGREIVVSTFGLAEPNVRVGRDNSIWIINVETGAKRELIKTEGSFPVWSPSGKRIAFWFYPPGLGRRDIATVSVDGGEPVVVTKDFAVSNWNPVWSPDGKFLYFISDRNGNQNFWRVRIDEETGGVLSPPEPVGTPSKYSRHLNFSRDGKRMIYVSTNNQSNVQAVEFDLKNETIIGEPFWITRGDRAVTRAELSSDSKQFLMRYQ